VSKLWSPYNLYNNIIGWWDSRDILANNGVSYPRGAGTTIDVGAASTPIIKDKSLTRSDFNAEITLTGPNNNIPSRQPWTVLYYQIAGATVTNGGNAGAYGGAGAGLVSSAYSQTINQQAFNGDLEGGNWLAPREGSFAKNAGRLNLIYSNDVVQSVESMTLSRNAHVGDTFYPDVASTQNGVTLTVSSVRERGGLTGNGTFSTDAKSSFPSNFRLFIMCVLCDDTDVNTSEAFLKFEDQDGTNHIELIYEVPSGGLGYLTAKTAMKVRYKDSGGTTRESSGSATVTANTHILFEFEFNSSSSYVSEFLNGSSIDSTATTTAIQFPTNYKIKMGNGTAFEFFEMIMVDEDEKHLSLAERQLYHGYFAHKYSDTHLELVNGHPYKTTPPYANNYLYGGAHKLNPREPLQMVKMYLDECDNVYGSTVLGSNCEATISVGNECYNTKHTCTNTPRYRINQNGKKVIAFSQEVGNNLAGYEPSAHPALISISSAPNEIQPTKGVSVRSNITIKLRDFISNDKGIDPYFATRNIIALENGTFFQKLLARNPHYYGRPIEIYDGFFDYDGTPQVHDGKREYIIESIHLDNDICTIKCKDPMSLADDLKSKVPEPTHFSLGEDLGNLTSYSHINLKYDDIALDGSSATDKKKVTDYFGDDNATGFIRIDEEILGYRVDVSGNEAAIDITSRGQWGSVASTDTYETGDAVQKCLAYGTYNTPASGSTINDVVYDILVNNSGVSPSYINNAAGGEYSWVDEKTAWVATFKINTLLSEPQTANDVIGQLAQSVGVNFFYDDLATKIIMRAETPEPANSQIPLITDNEIVEDSLKLLNSEKDRVSRVYYYFNQKDLTTDRKKPKNYKSLFTNIDIDSESAEEYGKQSNKVINAWGITASSTSTTISQRLLSRFKNTPKTVEFKLDVGGERIRTGQHFFLQTKSIISQAGIIIELEMQCLSSKYDSKNQQYIIKAKQFRFTSKNGCTITPNVFQLGEGANAGTNYVVGETLTFSAGSNSATGIQIRVDAINTANGAVTKATLTNKGDLNTANKYVVDDLLNYASGSTNGSGLQIQIKQEYFKGDGGGTGTELDKYTGVRATGGYLADASDNLLSDNTSQPYLII
jgi:hypothetical protein